MRRVDGGRGGYEEGKEQVSDGEGMWEGGMCVKKEVRKGERDEVCVRGGEREGYLREMVWGRGCRRAPREGVRDI